MPLITPHPSPKFRTKSEADNYFMLMALDERKASDDPKAQYVVQSGVAAIIVRDGKLIAKSANVLPPSLKAHHVETAKSISEDERYHFVEHAERAAIMQALLRQESLEGATLYCTRFACSDCARAIIWSGIKRVVFASGFAGEAKWLLAQRAAKDMLRLER